MRLARSRKAEHSRSETEDGSVARPSSAREPLDRREFMTAAVLALCVAGVPHLARGSEADRRLVTDFPEQAAMISALRYVGRSEDPVRHCASCQFFTLRVDGKLGNCMFFAQGLVEAGGHCDYWVEAAV